MTPQTFNLDGVRAWETPSLPSVPEGFYEGVISALHDVHLKENPNGAAVGVRAHVQITGGEQNGRQVIETLWYPKPSGNSDADRGKLAALAKSLGQDPSVFVLSDAVIGKVVRFHYRPKDEEAGIKDARVTFQSLAVWTSSRAAAGLTNAAPAVDASQLNAALAGIVQGVVPAAAPATPAAPAVVTPPPAAPAAAPTFPGLTPDMIAQLQAAGIIKAG